MLDDVIVAIATPYGKAGIAVIRMSGKGCLNLAKKMFTPFSKDATYEPNLMVLGKIDLSTTYDKGFLVYFKSPKSYTGEDVVEFQCHGGVYVAQRIVEKAISLGARLAEAGEFSKRAFLNGKMSLDEAEGVIDTINAETESELRASSDLVRGRLYNKIKALQDVLIDVMSNIEVNLDYPEHDIEYETKNGILKDIKNIENEISTLLSSESKGRLIKNGINVAIVGRPNVGKSMLLNALVGEDQAIVTDIAGTTRDVVTASVEYNGIKINFLDTAGLRKTNDIVENIGIEKAKQALEKSDLVLSILDASTFLTDEDKEMLDLVADKQKIIILNKIDLPQKLNFEGECIKLSAKQNLNIDELKERIYNMAMATSPTSSSLVLTNLRHVSILKEAKDMCQNIIENDSDLTLDLVALDCRLLYEKLGEITGESATEEVIDRIFSKFCLGK